jgi:hypothetical protein
MYLDGERGSGGVLVRSKGRRPELIPLATVHPRKRAGVTDTWEASKVVAFGGFRQSSRQQEKP